MSGKSMFAVMVLLFAAASSAIAQSSGGFTFHESKDGFTDEDRSFVYTIALDSKERGASLGWKCMDDGLNVLYLYDKYLGGDRDDEVRVRYRIDDRPAYGPAYWGLMQGNRSAYMPMHEVRNFTNAARTGSTILFEVVDPLDGERLSDRFSLQGLAGALRQLPCAVD